MQTLRGRLTAWYSVALALTLAAFAAVLYVDRRSASYQELDQRLRSEAALTAATLAESYRARGALVRADTAERPALGAHHRDAPPRSRWAQHPLRGPLRHGGRPPVWGDPQRGELPLGRARCRAAARHVRIGAAARARRRGADRVLDLAPRARRRRSDHHRGARDQRRAEPAPSARGATGEGRAGPPGRDAEPNDDAARAELRRPAPLHRRREPRAQDAAHGAARRGGARDHDAAPAPRDARDAGRNAAGDQAHDGARGRAAHAGARGRGL